MRDPPEHKAIRRLISRAFTKSAVDAYRPFVEATVTALLDELEPRGAMNFLADFAFRLPTVVIAELMQLSSSSRDGLDELLIDLDLAFVFQDQLEYLERGDRAVEELARRMDTELAARRGAPGDDLLSRLLRGEDGGADVDIDHADLVANAVLLLQAGHDTTMNTLTSGVYTLLQHPEEFARLKADPSLVPSAVEEFLRYNSAIGIAPRVATEDVELPVGTVRAGSSIPFFLGAVNRDPRVFDDPDRFDVARTPNPHLAFAGGIHLCVGAPLARLELQVALDAIVRRLPNLRLVEEPRWTGVLPFRGLDKLLVEWT
jgi:cytochrome P450